MDFRKNNLRIITAIIVLLLFIIIGILYSCQHRSSLNPVEGTIPADIPTPD